MPFMLLEFIALYINHNFFHYQGHDMVRKSDVITFYYFYDQENTDNAKQKKRNRNSFLDAIYLLMHQRCHSNDQCKGYCCWRQVDTQVKNHRHFLVT